MERALAFAKNVRCKIQSVKRRKEEKTQDRHNDNDDGHADKINLSDTRSSSKTPSEETENQTTMAIYYGFFLKPQTGKLMSLCISEKV